MKKSLLILGVLSTGLAHAQQEGRVGINTDAPSATLNVKSKVDNGKNLELENKTGTKLVTVLDNGNVGINNPSPLYRLDINGLNDGYNGNSVALRGFRDRELAGAFDFYRARGTKDAPLTLQNGDAIGSIGFLGYDGAKYRHGFRILSQVTGELAQNANNVDASLFFIKETGAADGNRVMTIHHSGKVGIGTIEPEERLHVKGGGIRSELLTTSGIGGYLEMVNPAKAGVGNEAKVANWRIYNMTGGYTDGLHFYGYAENNPNGPIAGLNPLLTLADVGKVGIGVNQPSEKLDVNGNVRLRTLPSVQGATTDKVVVIDNTGVLKTVERSALGGSATQVGTGEDNMPCNEANRGKMNFKKDVPLQGGGRADAFAVCLKASDGNFFWRYLYGGQGVLNQTGNFGENLPQ